MTFLKVVSFLLSEKSKKIKKYKEIYIKVLLTKKTTFDGLKRRAG